MALPEGAFWLLVTGEVPTEEEVKGLTQEPVLRRWGVQRSKKISKTNPKTSKNQSET